MSESVLVVDDDPDVARFVEVNLRSAGYDVTVASNGEEGLNRAIELRPDLVLLDVMMPKLDGFEVAQRLRRDPRTSSSSIIMLTAKALSSDKVLGLSSGADDYIIKPFDPVELLARVKGTLRRAREMRALSPLTGLPGNIRVQEEIRRRVSEENAFALLYADLDHFKAYNDNYGFVRGDRAIQALARLVTETVHEVAGPAGFVGHVGGDDFVILVEPEQSDTVAKSLCDRFDQLAPTLYDAEDAERGFIEVRDRQGNPKSFPLLTISVGVATTLSRRFSHYGEAVAVATEMKQFAKRDPNSSFAVDRRSVG
jgi:diguanylate cyclase (GGDEF)-like protein